jgi:hypothetical protein
LRRSHDWPMLAMPGRLHFIADHVALEMRR